MRRISSFLILMISFTLLLGQTVKKGKTEQVEPKLIETRWVVLSIEGKAVTEKNEITPYILFDKGNLFYGNTGCNSFYGKFSVKKNKLKLKYSGATKTLCKKMETETAFLKILKHSNVHFSIKDSILVITNNDQELLRCRVSNQYDRFKKEDDKTIEITAPSLNQDRIEKEESMEDQETRD